MLTNKKKLLWCSNTFISSTACTWNLIINIYSFCENRKFFHVKCTMNYKKKEKVKPNVRNYNIVCIFRWNRCTKLLFTSAFHSPSTTGLGKIQKHLILETQILSSLCFNWSEYIYAHKKYRSIEKFNYNIS